MRIPRNGNGSGCDHEWVIDASKETTVARCTRCGEERGLSDGTNGHSVREALREFIWKSFSRR